MVGGLSERTLAMPEEAAPSIEVADITTSSSADDVLSDAKNSSLDQKPMEQVTSVSQLRDVQPTDWAFQALQSLVERYGCIAGYPNQTYRGNRALTRYEFAAGLNACLDRVNELIATATNDLVTRDDLTTLQKLQEEFSAELATLRGRVDALEARTAELEANQFSTTTKLKGITIIGFQGRTSNRADTNKDGTRDTEDPGTNTNVITFNQLFLNTQFSPRGYLVTGLYAGTGSTSPKLSSDFLLGYELFTNSSFIVNHLHYHHLITDNLAMMVGTAGVDMLWAFRGPNREESASNGPLSWFAQRNPILNVGFNGGGVAFDWQFTKNASLQAIYTSLNPGNPGSRSGLFDGNTTTGVQLLLTPAKTLDTSLYYVNNYSSNGELVPRLVGEGVGDFRLANDAPLQTNAFGATVNWRVSPQITLGAWGGYTNSRIPGESGNVETTNYMFYANFPDLFGKGNLGGIYVGQPPKITSSDLPVGKNIPDVVAGGPGGQPGTTTHIEAFYRWRLTDNISVTPGIIHIIEPGHTPDSDSITLGIVRTSFTF
ncbi:MAG: iron uptake porin [Calothrix sp. MO_192.B10]|nr:iron uptake porin [Calothrix sp. MO_192.B10]